MGSAVHPLAGSLSLSAAAGGISFSRYLRQTAGGLVVSSAFSILAARLSALSLFIKVRDANLRPP
jgi:hypothetical protein